MKIFHKKFLMQDMHREKDKDMSIKSKIKAGYWLNQVLIWGTIFVIIFFIFKFYTLSV